MTAITNKLAEATTAVSQPPPAPSAPASAVDAKEVQAQIQKLESSLAEVPEGEDSIKEMLTTRINEKKQLLAAGRPAGARLDQARAALMRAKGRQSDAQAAIEAASALKVVADSEVTQYEKEVAELEAQLVQPAPGSPEQPMEQVQRLLCGMLESLRDDPFVPTETWSARRTTSRS